MEMVESLEDVVLQPPDQNLNHIKKIKENIEIVLCVYKGKIS